MNINYKYPANFNEYTLLDSGNFEKLERFGQYILRRPEPQAIWDKTLSENEWQKLANATFVLKKQEHSDKIDNHERGEWKLKPGMPDRWTITYEYKEMQIRMRLALTSFKHIGIFPEQAENWNFIYDAVKKWNTPECKVLNLFAYTGGASLAAKAAGAQVTHVDAVKQVISWSKENMEMSKLDNIRWIVDDAMKFVNREVRRDVKYNGIILDPPAYGRGPEGEKWILEKSLNELLKQCALLLAPNQTFVVLNMYSMGFSPLVANNLVQNIFKVDNVECGELYVTDKKIKPLPLGIFARYSQF